MSHEEALGFAQILLALLVFALGIPALVIEATAEERIRHLVHKRVPHWPMILLMTFTLIVVGGLVRVSGWAAETPPSADAIVSRGATVELRNDDLAWERVYGNITADPPQLTQSDRSAKTIERTAKALTLILLPVFAAFWLLMMKIDVRTYLVWSIGGRMRRRFRRRGSFRDEQIEDLIVLGENGPSGYEKDVVIRQIGKVCRSVGKSEEYGGTELTPLIIGLQRIVTCDHRPGTPQNFHKALQVLGECWTVLSRSNRLRKKDGATVIEIAAALGGAAIRAGNEQAATASMNAVRADEQVVFRVGVAALRHGRYRVALAALAKLEIAADRMKTLPKELLALVSEFCHAGDRASEFARAFQQRLGDSYSREQISVAAQRAADEFFLMGECAIADRVSAFGRTYADARTIA